MKRILIVDDEEMLRSLLSEFATQAGYIPFTASSPEEALAIFTREQIGIVLTDMILHNEMDGVSLCVRLKYESARVGAMTVVVAMTGYATEYDIAYCLGAGFNDVLSKPISYKDFKSSMDCACAMRERWVGGKN